MTEDADRRDLPVLRWTRGFSLAEPAGYEPAPSGCSTTGSAIDQNRLPLVLDALARDAPRVRADPRGRARASRSRPEEGAGRADGGASSRATGEPVGYFYRSRSCWRRGVESPRREAIRAVAAVVGTLGSAPGTLAGAERPSWGRPATTSRRTDDDKVVMERVRTSRSRPSGRPRSSRGHGRTVVGLVEPIRLADRDPRERGRLAPRSSAETPSRKTSAERGPERVKAFAQHQRTSLPIGCASGRREDASKACTPSSADLARPRATRRSSSSATAPSTAVASASGDQGPAGPAAASKGSRSRLHDIHASSTFPAYAERPRSRASDRTSPTSLPRWRPAVSVSSTQLGGPDR